jgi:hypothetical protein
MPMPGMGIGLGVPVAEPRRRARCLGAAIVLACAVQLSTLAPAAAAATVGIGPFSTYLGGGGDDGSAGVAVDAAGNVYVVSQTASSNFPAGATIGPGGAYDIAVTKFSPSGTVIYSTRIGGSQNDTVANGSQPAIAVDGLGDAYVAGVTQSSDFPTVNAAQTAPGGGFLLKLDPTGDRLVYSTYLGDANTTVFAVTVNAAGNAWISGNATSFPVTSNAYQTSNKGIWDALVAEFSPSGALQNATYLGGSSFDESRAITIAPNGDVVVGGDTASKDFPVTGGAFQTSCLQCITSAVDSNFRAGFVSELNPELSALVFSSYLSGSVNDMVASLAIDTGGAVYATGRTQSPDFPTRNAYQSTYGRSTDSFASKLSPDGSSLVYSTFLGGSNTDYGYGVAVDSAGDAWLTGQTFSSDFPHANAYQPTLKSSADVFVTELTAEGGTAVFSTYLGGSSGGDAGLALAVTGGGLGYLAGFTRATDFPTVHAAQTAYGGGAADGFVAVLQSPAVPTDVPELPLPPVLLVLAGLAVPAIGVTRTASRYRRTD